jgi:hypothetical protein
MILTDTLAIACSDLTAPFKTPITGKLLPRKVTANRVFERYGLQRDPEKHIQ